MTSNPTEDPVWRALAAEAGIASDQIGDGATLLAKTSPQYSWTFSRAFFPLSTGIERACKLALQIDARLESGKFLSMKEMKGFSHGLDGLVAAVDAVNKRRGVDLVLPDTEVHRGAIEVLHHFATTGRYHHLDDLAGRAGGMDPSKLWWEKVVEPVADLHYTDDKRASDEMLSQELGRRMDEFSLVRHSLVAGGTTTSVVDMLRDGAMSEAAIPWARMYVLQIARWLGQSMSGLSDTARLANRPEIPDLQEFFQKFMTDDRSMRTRKNWRPMS